MTQVKNTGQTAIPYRGGYIFPGRVKDVAAEDIDSLREQGDFIVLPTQRKPRRPSVSKEAAVVEAPSTDKKPTPEKRESASEDNKKPNAKERRKLKKNDEA